MHRKYGLAHTFSIIEPIPAALRLKYSEDLQRVARVIKEKQTWNRFQICRWWSIAAFTALTHIPYIISTLSLRF